MPYVLRSGTYFVMFNWKVYALYFYISVVKKACSTCLCLAKKWYRFTVFCYLLLKCFSIFVPLYFLRVRLSICEYCSLFNKPHLFLIMKIWSKWTGQGVLIVKYSLPNHHRIRVNRSLYFNAHFTSVTICLTYCVLCCDRKTVPNIG